MAEEEDYEALIRWASVSLDQEQAELALQICERAIRARPDAPDGYYLRGRAVQELGRKDEALDCFDHALRVDGRYYPALLGRAMFLLESSPAEAAALCDRALSLDPEPEYRAWAYALQAEALLHCDARDRALRAAEEGLAFAPDHSELQLRRAWALYELGRFAEAASAVESVVSATPDLAFGRNLRARILQRLSRFEEAEQEFRRAAQLDPHDFGVPCRMSDEEFDRLLRQAIDEIRAPWRRHLENVQVSVMDFAPDDLIRTGVGPDVYGIYQGPTAHHRGPTMPARIVLFQRPMENRCQSREELRVAIEHTLRHEVAHHFGFDDDALPRPDTT